jgi:Uma2 family endonuclease
MAAPVIPYYTYEDYKQWDGDWELVKGIPFAMAPSPVYEHQYVSGKIFRQLDEKLDNCDLCEVAYEVDVKFSEDTVLRPDVAVFCYKIENYPTKAPDIVFEVVSKNSVRMDEEIKFEIYKDEKVKYYVLVYLSDKKAKVYKLNGLEYEKVGDFSDEKFMFETKCKIEFDFSKIWRNK